jgi:hypothetical protein
VTTAEKVALLKKLFVLREDTYARQWFEEGRGGGYYPVRVLGDCPENCGKKMCRHLPNAPITDAEIIRHLKGDITIGLYQLNDEDEVKWLCFDIDVNKGVTPSEEILSALQAYTITFATALAEFIPGQFYVEFSGNRGYHVWVFFDAPIAASKVAAFGGYLAEYVEPPANMHVEVYPKQTFIQGYGNLVKLPLGVHRKTDQRCFFVRRDFTPHPDQWKVLQNVRFVTEEELDEIVSYHKIHVIERSTSVETGETNKHAPVCLVRIMSEGLPEGMRDEGTFRVASYLREQGLPRTMTFAALNEWNDQYNDPPMTEEEIERKMESAYSRAYGFRPCHNPAFDAYCSSSCTSWSYKLRHRWKDKPRKSAVGTISRD